MKIIFFFICIFISLPDLSGNDTICNIKVDHDISDMNIRVYTYDEYIYVHEMSDYSVSIFSKGGDFISRISSQYSPDFIEKSNKNRTVILRPDLFGTSGKTLVLFCVLDNSEYTYTLAGRYLSHRKIDFNINGKKYYVPSFLEKLQFISESTYLLPIAIDLKGERYSHEAIACITAANNRIKPLPNSLWPDFTADSLKENCRYYVFGRLTQLGPISYLTNSCNSIVVKIESEKLQSIGLDTDIEYPAQLLQVGVDSLLLLDSKRGGRYKAYILDYNLHVHESFFVPDNIISFLEWNSDPYVLACLHNKNTISIIKVNK
ncbi:MAG: hypothetical protein KF690_04240 [Bacteroidetes bacterium]|nr:hypothetical protein [Bacteroidota bacterium]